MRACEEHTGLPEDLETQCTRLRPVSRDTRESRAVTLFPAWRTADKTREQGTAGPAPSQGDLQALISKRPAPSALSRLPIPSTQKPDKDHWGGPEPSRGKQEVPGEWTQEVISESCLYGDLKQKGDSLEVKVPFRNLAANTGHDLSTPVANAVCSSLGASDPDPGGFFLPTEKVDSPKDAIRTDVGHGRNSKGHKEG